MIIYIVSAVDLVLTALFAILNKYVWKGFAYFVLSLLLALALAWGIWLVYKYFTAFKKEMEEEFNEYKIRVMNKEKITSKQFEEAEESYRKSFKKTLIKQIIFKWFIICFCFSIAVSFLLAMIFYK